MNLAVLTIHSQLRLIMVSMFGHVFLELAAPLPLQAMMIKDTALEISHKQILSTKPLNTGADKQSASRSILFKYQDLAHAKSNKY